MIEAVSYQKEVRHVDVKKINLSRNSYVIDIYNPDLKELYLVSNLTKVFMSDLKTCLDTRGIPRVEKRDNYLIVVFRAIADGRTTPFGLIIGSNFILVIHTKQIKQITPLVKEVDVKLFKFGKEAILHKIFYDVIKDFEDSLEKLEDEIDVLDKNILKIPSQNLVNQLFTLKRTSVYYRKAIYRNRDVLVLLQNMETKFIKKKNDFGPLAIESMQIMDIEELLKDRLSNLLEVHLSNTSNKLNETMKSFTVIASLLLLPLLISGIYGMNFKFIPLAENYNGFYIIIGIMILSVFITYSFYKLRRWA
nr:hypothetical protein [Candidatus Woesearchaeota archaeon]